MLGLVDHKLRVLALVVTTGLVASACAAPTDENEEPSGTSESELRCTAAAATKLASVARKMDGRRSTGYCYRYVKAHMRAAGMSTSSLESQGYGGSAYKFTVWANANPSGLAKMGLQKVRLGLNELPKGAVIVWPRGMCGYNRTHGHIEVVVDDNSSRACSDFCGSIKKGCGTPDVFIPKGCTQARPDEADDEDDSQQASPDDEEPATTGGDDEGGGCWSPTLNEQAEEMACVQSRSNEIWFQCKQGKWYRGVSGSSGPFAPCNGRFPL